MRSGYFFVPARLPPPSVVVKDLCVLLVGRSAIAARPATIQPQPLNDCYQYFLFPAFEFPAGSADYRAGARSQGTGPLVTT
jgi:hypothetical protein